MAHSCVFRRTYQSHVASPQHQRQRQTARPLPTNPQQQTHHQITNQPQFYVDSINSTAILASTAAKKFLRIATSPGGFHVQVARNSPTLRQRLPTPAPGLGSIDFPYTTRHHHATGGWRDIEGREGRGDLQGSQGLL